MSESYILITAAKNEEDYIEKTIQSVIHQTLLPTQWIIVSDGSTDKTDVIVESYLKDYSFISLVKRPVDTRRDFASKVFAIREGHKHILNNHYQFYGNLDADVSFDKNYYQKLIEYFNTDPKLGIIGGQVYDAHNDTFQKQKNNIHSVSGPIQFFRKACFEATGGFIPFKYGLEDAMIEVNARMKGWKTRTIPELTVYHHRKTSTHKRNMFQVAYREGMLDYYFGLHPIFQMGRAFQRFNSNPIVLGSFIRISGYWIPAFQRKKRPVSKAFLKYLHKEEFETIKQKLRIK